MERVGITPDFSNIWNDQLCWMPLGHVWFFTGFRISSISDMAFSSFPTVATSTAAATFSSTCREKHMLSDADPRFVYKLVLLHEIGHINVW